MNRNVFVCVAKNAVVPETGQWENAVKAKQGVRHFSRYERWHDQVNAIAKVKTNRTRAKFLRENGKLECAGMSIVFARELLQNGEITEQ